MTRRYRKARKGMPRVELKSVSASTAATLSTSFTSSSQSMTDQFGGGRQVRTRWKHRIRTGREAGAQTASHQWVQASASELRSLDTSPPLPARGVGWVDSGEDHSSVVFMLLWGAAFAHASADMPLLCQAPGNVESVKVAV